MQPTIIDALPESAPDERAQAIEALPTPIVAPRPERAPRWQTYLVVVAVAALLALCMLGGLLTVGDHLMDASPVLGWTFYVLVGALAAVGVVVPLVKVARRPVFSLYQLRDEQGRAHTRRCRMLADNLVSNTRVTSEQAREIEAALASGDRADDLLIDYFERTVVPAIDEETRKHATTAFLATAVSHSALVDTATMLSISLDLVRSIVETCGFRPTNLALARLYLRVMAGALVAGGIEDADLDDLLGNALGGGAAGKASGILLGSAAGGLASAFMTFRIGVITKRWLCAVDGPARMASLRRTSYREALAQMKTSGFMQEVAAYTARVAKNVATSVVDGAQAAARAAATATVSAAGKATRAATDAVRAKASQYLHRDLPIK